MQLTTGYRLLSAPGTTGGAGEGEQDERAEGRDRDGTPEAGAIRDAEQTEEEATNRRAEQSDYDIPDAAESPRAGEQTGQPPGQQTHDDPGDDPTGVQINREKGRG
jgi:hypothetical protein